LFRPRTPFCSLTKVSTGEICAYGTCSTSPNVWVYYIKLLQLHKVEICIDRTNPIYFGGTLALPRYKNSSQ